MSMRLFDPERSRVVLIGTSRYDSDPELHALPAVRGNLTALESVLTDPARCGLPPEHVEVVTDPANAAAVGAVLGDAAEAAEDLLLIYYAGHGLIDSQGSLYLGLTTTRSGVQLRFSALPYEWIRGALHESGASTRVVVLDCCFSGRAINAQAGPEAVIGGQVEIEDAYTLTSTSRNRTALAPEGARFTAFTGELLDLLRNGVPDGPEIITLDLLYFELRRALMRKGMPRPEAGRINNAHQLGISRNVAARRPALPGAAPSAAPAAAPATPERLRHPQAVAQAVETVTRLIARTYGPEKGSAFVRSVDGGYVELHDAASIVARMDPEDPLQRVGLEFVRDLVQAVRASSSDGSATAAIIAEAMIRGCLGLAVGDAHPAQLTRGLDQALRLACRILEDSSRELETKEQIRDGVALAVGDRAVGEIVAEALEKVGKAGVCVVEEADRLGLKLELVEGIRLDSGYLSARFVKDDAVRGEIVLHQPYLLLCDFALDSNDHWVPLLESVLSTGRPLVVIAHDVTGEALATLVVNTTHATLTSVAVKGPVDQAVLGDLAVLTDGQIVSAEVSLESVRPETLGQARKVIVDASTTTIVDGAGPEDAILARGQDLRRQIQRGFRVGTAGAGAAPRAAARRGGGPQGGSRYGGRGPGPDGGSLEGACRRPLPGAGGVGARWWRRPPRHRPCPLPERDGRRATGIRRRALPAGPPAGAQRRP
jgi:TCP-1/cpn60 chaperonin family protein/caspase domain-containing protein